MNHRGPAAVRGLAAAETRLRHAATGPAVLDAAFEGFETIRLAARACEDRAPGLFAAFVLAAGAAVEGRNAVTDAPSLPLARNSAMAAGAGGDVDQIADQVASLAALLTRRLADLAAHAADAGDRAACLQAASAAGQIHRLLARDGDETCPG